MAKCSQCGAEDDLAIPFIDGVCEGCIRREVESRPDMFGPKVSPRAFRETMPKEPAKPWSGLKFISWSGGLGLLSIFSGVMVGAFPPLVDRYPLNEDLGLYNSYEYNNPLNLVLFLVSIGLGVWSSIFLVVGVIRWGVRPSD